MSGTPFPPSPPANQLVFHTTAINPHYQVGLLNALKNTLVTVFTRSHTYHHHFMCTTLNSQRAGYQEEFTLLDPSGPSTPVIHPASLSSAHPSALMSSAHPSLQPSSMQPTPLNNDTLTMNPK